MSRPWVRSELQRLIDAVEAGDCAPVIADVLDRSVPAVVAEAERQGLEQQLYLNMARHDLRLEIVAGRGDLEKSGWYGFAGVHHHANGK